MNKFCGVIFLIASIMSYCKAQEILSIVYPYKDGYVSVSEFNGSSKQIVVDGSIGQTKGWITFVTDSMNFTGITSAKLLLYVRSLLSPGTLKIHLLKQSVTAPENNVSFTELQYYSEILTSVYIGSSDIEKIIQIDIAESLRNGNMYGIALTSDDGLIVMIDAKEGISKPMILLTTRIITRSSKWFSGNSTPPVDSGLAGDYFLNIYNGNVYQKKVNTWSFLMNIIGPQGQAGQTGPKGDQGETGSQGVKGDKGDPGATGIQGSPGLDGKSFVWRGIWSSGVAYCSNDVVQYNGSSYTAKLNVNGILPTDTTYWNLMASKGDTGPAGSTGPAGPSGTAGVKGDKGDPGSTGIQGPPGLDGKSFVWRGIWSSGIAYCPNDVVQYNGSAYTAKLNVNGNLPIETAYWDIMASKGDTGPAGSTGPAGPSGTAGVKGDKGDPGSAGIQGPPGADGKSFVLHGSWSVDSSYSAYDLVRYNGSSYAAKVNVSGILPVDTAYWCLMALMGEKGDAPVSFSDDTMTIRGVNDTVLIALDLNRAAFSIGQQIRVVRTDTIKDFLEGHICTYSTVNGLAKIAVDYSRGYGKRDSSWTIMVAGLPASGGWTDAYSGVNTYLPVGIGGTPGTDALSVYGNVSIGSSGVLKFTDGTEQSTAFNSANISTNPVVQELQDSINSLNTRLNNIEALLSNLSKTGNDMFLTGVNLWIQNGTGKTDTATSTGNLILGYNEETGNNDYRDGSHNLIVGKNNSFSSYGSVVSGYRNYVKAPYSSAIGGSDNRVEGNYAVVVGGQLNSADSSYSGVYGGSNNNARQIFANTFGGRYNAVEGQYSVVSGGGYNTASGDNASVSGGEMNFATGYASSVTGGQNDSANGSFSSVAGGNFNVTTGNNTHISGGFGNRAEGYYASVAGGSQNIASGHSSVVAGGESDTASGMNAVIAGGKSNNASGSVSSISGGMNNIASGYGASVSGGTFNEAKNEVATVSGGKQNKAMGNASSISGGAENETDSIASSVAGGHLNTAHSLYGFIGGGSANKISDTATVVVGGVSNIAVGNGTVVVGGESDTARGLFTVVGGGFQNVSDGRSTVVNGGQKNKAEGQYSTINGGTSNNASGTAASVSGGTMNIANGSEAVVSGGSMNSASAIQSTVGGGSNNNATVNNSWIVGPYSAP